MQQKIILLHLLFLHKEATHYANRHKRCNFHLFPVHPKPVPIELCMRAYAHSLLSFILSPRAKVSPPFTTAFELSVCPFVALHHCITKDLTAHHQVSTMSGASFHHWKLPSIRYLFRGRALFVPNHLSSTLSSIILRALLCCMLGLSRNPDRFTSIEQLLSQTWSSPSGYLHWCMSKIPCNSGASQTWKSRF